MKHQMVVFLLVTLASSLGCAGGDDGQMELSAQAAGAMGLPEVSAAMRADGLVRLSPGGIYPRLIRLNLESGLRVGSVVVVYEEDQLPDGMLGQESVVAGGTTWVRSDLEEDEKQAYERPVAFETWVNRELTGENGVEAASSVLPAVDVLGHPVPPVLQVIQPVSVPETLLPRWFQFDIEGGYITAMLAEYPGDNFEAIVSALEAMYGEPSKLMTSEEGSTDMLYWRQEEKMRTISVVHEKEEDAVQVFGFAFSDIAGDKVGSGG